MTQQKKSVNFGFRGWMLLVYQFIAYIAMTAYTNYPLNILADVTVQTTLCISTTGTPVK